MVLPAKYGEPSFKKIKKWPTLKIFFAKSLKSAKWTCLPNMVSLAQWEVGPTKFCDYDAYYAYAYYTYNQSILMANSWRAKEDELFERNASSPSA